MSFGKPQVGSVTRSDKEFDSMDCEDGTSSPPPALLSESEQVMSEVHLGCPPNHSGPHLSHFTILLPSSHGKPNFPIFLFN